MGWQFFSGNGQDHTFPIIKFTKLGLRHKTRLGSRQSRGLPENVKKLVIRQPIKKNNPRSGAKKIISGSLYINKIE